MRKERAMARSGRRNKAEGWFDKLAGSMTKLSGRLTGNKKDKRKGRTTRLRGHVRGAKGRTKRAA
jgi:uncharacterized protein YjbJ (UPF0337 family)